MVINHEQQNALSEKGEASYAKSLTLSNKMDNPGSAGLQLIRRTQRITCQNSAAKAFTADAKHGRRCDRLDRDIKGRRSPNRQLNSLPERQ